MQRVAVRVLRCEYGAAAHRDGEQAQVQLHDVGRSGRSRQVCAQKRRDEPLMVPHPRWPDGGGKAPFILF